MNIAMNKIKKNISVLFTQKIMKQYIYLYNLFLYLILISFIVPKNIPLVMMYNGK